MSEKDLLEKAKYMYKNKNCYFINCDECPFKETKKVKENIGYYYKCYSGTINDHKLKPIVLDWLYNYIKKNENKEEETVFIYDHIYLPTETEEAKMLIGHEVYAGNIYNRLSKNKSDEYNVNGVLNKIKIDASYPYEVNGVYYQFIRPCYENMEFQSPKIYFAMHESLIKTLKGNVLKDAIDRYNEEYINKLTDYEQRLRELQIENNKFTIEEIKKLLDKLV